MNRLHGLVTVSVLGLSLLVACSHDCCNPLPGVTVTDVSPASDLVNGGTAVTITGTNFINVTSVTIGGSELGGRTVVSTTQITGTTPAAANPGTTDVVVTSSSHGSGTCRGCFRYISPVRQAQLLAAGDYHTCAIKSGWGAYCWGNNFWGQLGDGSVANSGTAVAVV